MIPQSVRRPLFWFTAECLLLAAVLALTGRFSVERAPDTPSYEDFSFASLHEALTGPRTLGYPIYLRATGWLSENQRWAPVAHFVLHLLAVCVLWRALVALSWSVWTSMIVASSLLYSNMLLRYVGILTPDCLASSCAIASMGFLLLVVARRDDKVYWACLVLSVLCTYQLRPAYLFLPLLTPLLGSALWWLTSDRGITRWQCGGMFLGLAAASLAPLLAFSLARWWLAGHFGLVAFGGMNVAGVVSSFLTLQDAERLPAAVRPLASTIARKRQALAATSPGFPAEPTRSYIAIERQFDDASWVICPAAREHFGQAWPEINRALVQYSMATIECQPTRYANWLGKAFVRGLYMIVSELIVNPVYLILGFLLGAVHVTYVVLVKRSQAYLQRSIPDAYFWKINTLGLVAIAFALAKTISVIVTTPPLGRFMDAAGIFLPLVLAQVLVQHLESTRAVPCRNA